MKVEGKQADDWAHTAALIAGVSNLFASEPINLQRLMPPHLRRKPAPPPGPDEAAASMRGLRRAFETQFGV